MKKSEGYLDIVWQQFKKNRFALAALWVLAPLFLLATFAPLIASSQPLVFYDADGQTLYPWFRALFHTTQWVDFAFNMALIGFLPWLAAALAANACGLWDGYDNIASCHQEEELSAPDEKNAAFYEKLLPLYQRWTAELARLSDERVTLE